MGKITRRWLVYPNTIPWISINNNRDEGLFDTGIIEKDFIIADDGSARCFVKENKGEKGKSFVGLSLSSDGKIEKKEQLASEDEWNDSFDQTEAYKVTKNRYSFSYNGYKYTIDDYRKPNNIGTIEIEFESEEDAKKFEPEFWFGREITEDKSYSDLNLAQNPKKFFTEIVLTGGPCGGKSTALANLKSMFEGQGYKVLVSSEVASDIIGSGAHPRQVPSYSFQRVMVQSMLAKEENMRLLAYEYFQKGNEKPVIIFYDRGIPDNSAYCDPKTWETILTELGLTSENLNHRYDGVIDIVTTARGANEVYDMQKSNNEARYETAEEACLAEDKIQQAYAGCNNFISVINTKSVCEEGKWKEVLISWQEKLNNIINAARAIVGLGPVLSINKRMIVRKPENIEDFAKKYKCVVQEIEQRYLANGNTNKEHRIRKIGRPGDWAYYETEKEINPDKHISTIQRVIDKETYNRLAKLKGDSTCGVIKKKRYSFVFNGGLQYNLDVFEDEYPGYKGKAVLGLKGQEKDKKVPVDLIPEELRKGTKVDDISSKPFFEYQIAVKSHGIEDSER